MPQQPYSIDDAISDRRMEEFAPLVHAIYGQESGGGKAKTDNPNYAGARGGMQITEETFNQLKKTGYIPPNYDWANPRHNLEAGVANIRYLSDRLGTKDPSLIAAGYYGGLGAVNPDGSINDRRDLKNPNAPTVAEYAKQINARMGGEPSSLTSASPKDVYEDPTKPEYYTGKKTETYKVTWTDGHVYNVQVPAGSDPNLAAFHVQQTYYPEAAPEPKKEAPGVLQTVRHTAEREALPTAAGFMGGFGGSALAGVLTGAGAGAATGAEAGTVVPGWGTAIGGIAGAIIGGIAAASGASKLQEKYLEAHPEQEKALGLDKETQAAEQEANPHTAMLTSVGMNLLGVRPSIGGIKGLLTSPAARKEAAVSAGLLGGVDVGQQMVSGQPYDPLQTLANVGLGAASHKEWLLGPGLRKAGEAPVRAAFPKSFPKAVAPPAGETKPTIEPEGEEGEEGEEAATTEGAAEASVKVPRKRKEPAPPPPAEDLFSATEVSPDATPVTTQPINGVGVPPVEPVPPPVTSEPPAGVGVPVSKAVPQRGRVAKPVDAGLDITEPAAQPVNVGEGVSAAPVEPITAPIEAVDPKVKAAQDFITSVESGTPLNPTKLRKIAHSLGIFTKTKDAPLDILAKVKSAVTSVTPEIETPPTAVSEPAPDPESVTKPTKVKEQKAQEIPVEGSDQDRADLQAHIEKLNTKLDAAHADNDYERIQSLEDELGAARAQLGKTETTAPKTELAPSEPVVPEQMRQPVKEPAKDLKTALMSGDMNAVLSYLSGGDKLSESTRSVYQSLAKLLRDGPSGYDERAGAPTDFSGVKLNVEGAEGHDAGAIDSIKARGKLAEYDPSSNTIHVTKEGMGDETILHEAIHAATVKSLRDFELESKNGFPKKVELQEALKNAGTPEAKQFASDKLQRHEDRLVAVQHIHDIFARAANSSVLGRPLKLKYPEAFKNVHEFAAYAMTNTSFQEDLAKIRLPKPVYTLNEMRYQHGKGGEFKSLWSEFTKALAHLFGLNKNTNFNKSAERISGLESDIANKKSQLEDARATHEETDPEEQHTTQAAIDIHEEELEDLKDKLIAQQNLHKKLSSTKTEGNALLELSHAISEILQKPTKVKGVEPLSATRIKVPKTPAEEKPIPTVEEAKADAAGKEKQKVDAHSFVRQMKDWGKEHIGTTYREVVKNFQNHAAFFSELQTALDLSNKLKTGFNDAYSALTLKPFKESEHSTPLKNRMHDAIRAYMKKAGRKWNEAGGDFKMWMIALNDPALRDYYFRKNVSLDNTKKFKVGSRKELVSAADRRTEAFDVLERLQADTPPVEQLKGLSQADANEAVRKYHKDKYGYDETDLRKLLDHLTDNYKNAAGHTDNPAVTNAGNPLDKDHPVYNVSGPFKEELLSNLRKDFAEKLADPELGPIIREVMAAHQAIQEKRIELNRLSGHWGGHVDTAVNFQNRGKNYFSLKGSQSESMNPFNDVKMSGEVEKLIQAQEQRYGESDNPLTQGMADMDLAVNRANRSEFLNRVANMVKDKTIAGSILKPIDVADRNSEFAEKVSAQSKRKVVFHYLPDGKIEPIRIDNPEALDAVKGLAVTEGPWSKAVGKATRLVSMGFTRYNPFFGPGNWQRHFLTNAGSISAGKYGPRAAAETVVRSLMGVATGSPFKAAIAAHLIANGDAQKLRDLGKYSSFFKNVAEYNDKGAFMSFKLAHSNVAETQQLAREMKGKPFVKTREGIEHVFEVWNNTFEIMNREAAYVAIKNAELRSGASYDDASYKSAAYTKNLLNLEESGKYSRPLSSWFALFKAEATGGIRSVEAFRPLFQSAESRLKSSPLYADAQKAIDKVNRMRDTALRSAGDDAEKINQINAKYDAEVKQAEAANFKMAPEELKAFNDNYNKLRMNAALTAMAALGIGMFTYARSRSSAQNDSEGRNKVATDDHSQWVRHMRLPANIIFGDDYEKAVGKGNDFINLSWGFGAGAFAAMGAQMEALFSGDTTMAETARNMGSAAAESFLPVPVASSDLAAKHPLGWLISSVSPSVARPLLEMAWNADDYGRQIYNNRLSKYGNAYTGGDYTSEVWKDAAKHIRETLGVDMSPSAIQFFANNYMEGVSNLMQGGYNQYLGITGQRDYDTRDLNPLRNFIGRSSNYDARQFSDIEPQIKGMKARIDAYINTGDDAGLERYLDKNPNAEDVAGAYGKIKAALNKVNSRLNQISASSMTPRERVAESEDLKQERDMLMANMAEIYKDAMR